MVSSYYDGPTIEDGDPWNLKDDGMFGRDFQWFEAKLAQADGGEEVEEELVSDGGEVATAVPTDVGEQRTQADQSTADRVD
jgi:cytochrome c oxidase subunit 1